LNSNRQRRLQGISGEFARFLKIRNVLISEICKNHVLCAEKVRRGKASRKSYGNNSRKEENMAVSKEKFRRNCAISTEFWSE
jgi:hypothetical protein